MQGCGQKVFQYMANDATVKNQLIMLHQLVKSSAVEIYYNVIIPMQLLRQSGRPSFKKFPNIILNYKNVLKASTER